MKMNHSVIPAFICILLLSSCGSPETPRPKVSRAEAPVSQGLTYNEFRAKADAKAHRDGGFELAQREAERAEGNYALHKRFIMLDRNSNGILSPAEFSGY